MVGVIKDFLLISRPTREKKIFALLENKANGVKVKGCKHSQIARHQAAQSKEKHLQTRTRDVNVLQVSFWQKICVKP